MKKILLFTVVGILLILTLYTLKKIGVFGFYKPEGVIDKTEEYVKINSGWIKLPHKVCIDGYTRIDDDIYCGEINCDVDPMSGIDEETFEVYPGAGYARDKYYIYYPIEVFCFDGTNCGVCFCSKYIVIADRKSFEYLGNGYAKDRNSAFFRGEIIQNADALTFEIVCNLRHVYLAKDKNHVFRFDNILKDATPATFNVDTFHLGENKVKVLAQDTLNEWIYEIDTSFFNLFMN